MVMLVAGTVAEDREERIERQRQRTSSKLLLVAQHQQRTVRVVSR